MDTMNVNFNPMLRRIELSILLFGASFIASLLTFGFTGVEIFLWRGIALGLSASTATFLSYPHIRGIKKGDVIYVPLWREIETPMVNESYLDTLPTIALEAGRRHKHIRVQLWDGSEGLAYLTHYGLITPPEGKLIEAEYTSPTKPFSTFGGK